MSAPPDMSHPVTYSDEYDLNVRQTVGNALIEAIADANVSPLIALYSLEDTIVRYIERRSDPREQMKDVSLRLSHMLDVRLEKRK